MYRNSNIVHNGGSSTYVAGDSIVHNHRSRAGFERLQTRVAAGAMHNSGEISDQPKCHPGTRVAILDHLISWAATLTYTFPIVWIHGPAGSGKSAIQRTIAQMLVDRGLLLASFFFFRTAVGRNSAEKFIPTIAYQLAVSIPAARYHIGQAIERNPLIFSLSLWEQAQAMIISPIRALYDDPSFNHIESPRIIVVDGLDECRDYKKQCEILQVLCRVVESLPIPFAILVASRPEHHIRASFDVGDLNKSSSRLSLDNSYKPDQDIKKFLLDRFAAIRENHPLKSCLPGPPWPPSNIVAKLVGKASGQFIYASTVDKFISSSRHNPAKRLDIILGILDAGTLKPFEQLDFLYSTIFHTVDPEDLPGTLRVLGAFLVPLDKDIIRSPEFIEYLLKLEIGDVRRFLFDLESLLQVGKDNHPIKFFHASLSDYLFDKSRSNQFWIDAGLIYADLAQQVIIHLLENPHDTIINSFFSSNRATLFSQATPTLELRQTIESYDFGHSRAYGNFLRSKLLQGICNSRFSDAKELYHLKRATYARSIHPQILVYHQDNALRHFLITATSTSLPPHDLRPIFHISTMMKYLDAIHGFKFLSEGVDESFNQVVWDLLDDPQGGYYVDANQHGDILLHLLKVMTEDSGLHLPAKSHEHTMLNILPQFLSASPIRHDLVEYIKNVRLDPSYMKPGISNGLREYILRSEAHESALQSHQGVILPKPALETSKQVSCYPSSSSSVCEVDRNPGRAMRIPTPEEDTKPDTSVNSHKRQRKDESNDEPSVVSLEGAGRRQSQRLRKRAQVDAPERTLGRKTRRS